MADFKVHTGRRKRPVRASQIEAFEKRKAGTKAEREAAARLYEPQEPRHGFCRAMSEATCKRLGCNQAGKCQDFDHG